MYTTETINDYTRRLPRWAPKMLGPPTCSTTPTLNMHLGGFDQLCIITRYGKFVKVTLGINPLRLNCNVPEQLM